MDHDDIQPFIHGVAISRIGAPPPSYSYAQYKRWRVRFYAECEHVEEEDICINID